MNYYVYIYYDPRKNPVEPIYVGKGKGKRISSHRNKAKNPILKRKISKMKEMGLEPIIEKYVDDIPNEEALKIEVELIAKYGRINIKTGTLCNLTEGGEGTSGRIATEETKRLLSKQRKGKKQTEAQYKANCSRTVSEERKEKMRQENKGKDFLTKEQRELITLKNKGRKHSKEAKERMSKQRKGKKQTEAQYEANCNRDVSHLYKKIKCLTNGKIYNSGVEAAKELGLDNNACSAVARGERKHCKNYVFTYDLS